MDQNPINHVTFVIDASGSMQGLASDVVKVTDRQIADLAHLSTQLDQETRISVYMFADRAQCIVYDKDVLRLPSIGKYYRASGQTALIDATLKGIDDLEKTAILYGDHAFLMYVQTDGGENASRNNAAALSSRLKGLSNLWTVACLVPNQSAKFHATSFGFAPGNVDVWDASSRTGLEEASETVSQATASYMNARASGLKSTTGLFSMAPAAVNYKSVSKLKELSGFRIEKVRDPSVIRPFIEEHLKLPFIQGNYFFLLAKREKVGPGKEVIIRHKISGKLYGGKDARTLLGLPDHEVSVKPEPNGEYDVFVQSTSLNRNLLPGHELLIRV